jgi:hypothetical protein
MDLGTFRKVMYFCHKSIMSYEVGNFRMIDKNDVSSLLTKNSEMKNE